ncbi:putative RING zinc finger domain superfamily protein [Iris pallida]|uniref:RING zinc finger domain superfamily protein n=1 Tax=Iris pallida TaxID=29817 RepID=A0AAX6FFX1_IRIPA|nr:putative RING zinc finger domain superfamily protein [Iris pallida]
MTIYSAPSPLLPLRPLRRRRRRLLRRRRLSDMPRGLLRGRRDEGAAAVRAPVPPRLHRHVARGALLLPLLQARAAAAADQLRPLRRLRRRRRRAGGRTSRPPSLPVLLAPSCLENYTRIYFFFFFFFSF